MSKADMDHHRGRAPLAGTARLAGLATIAAVEVQGAPTPDEVLEDQLVENCLRDDLKPIEQARAFESLMNRRSLTQAQVAEQLHLSPSTISRACRS